MKTNERNTLYIFIFQYNLHAATSLFYTQAQVDEDYILKSV